MASKKKTPTPVLTPAKKERAFKNELIDQMLKLCTAGFGLAAALAWNDTVKTIIEEYIKPYAAVGSGLLSQVLYALIVTLLAVAITYQLTKLSQKFNSKK